MRHLHTSLALIALTASLGASVGCSGCDDNPVDHRPPLPGVPQNLVATAGDRTVTLSWDSVAYASTYTIYWATATGIDVGTAAAVTTSSASYQQTGLTNGTSYFYVVTASNSSGQSAASAEVSATPQAGPTVPPAPTNLVAVGGDGYVTLYWDSVGDASGYRIYWATASGVTPQSSTPIEIAGTTFSHSGRQNGTRYYYVVTAFNSAGESAPSAEASAQPLASGGLAAPTHLVAMAGDGVVTLTWESVVGATAYTLYWSLDPHVTRSTGSAIASVTAPHDHSGRSNGTRYYYVVTASDGSGESAESNEVSAIPRAVSATEVEPNDELDPTTADLATFYSVGLANPCPPSHSLSGTVSGASKPDIDWFRIAVIEDGMLTVTLTPQGSPAGVDLDLQLLDATSMFPYGFGYSRRSGSSEQVVLPVHAGNSYYALVHDFEWSGADAGYTLGVSFAAATLDPADDNDVPPLATELTAVGPAAQLAISHTIGHAADVDWYQVSRLDPDLYYAVALTPAPERAYAIYQYTHDPAQTPQWLVENGPSDAPAVDEETTATVSYQEGHVYFAINGALKQRPVVAGPAEQRFYDPDHMYVLHIAASPASPRNVVASSPQAGQLRLRWDPSTGASSYNVYCNVQPGVTRDDGGLYGEAISTTTFHYLAYTGGHFYCIVSARNATGESRGSAEVDAVVNAGATSYLEPFSGTGLPAGWSETDLSGSTVHWAVGNNGGDTVAFDGSAFLYADTRVDGTVLNARLATAPIALPANATRLGFNSLHSSSFASVEVLISTDGTTWNPLGVPLRTRVWEFTSVDIAAFAGQSVRFAFSYNANSYDFWQIDNLAVW